MRIGRDFNFYCAWFCPYAQRAWMVLKELGVEHKYVEALELEGDGYVKNKRLLEINPKGLVPTLEVMSWSSSSEEPNTEIVCESILLIKWLYGNCKNEEIEPTLVEEAEEMDRLCCSPFYQVLMTQDAGEKRKAFLKWGEEGLAKFASGIVDGGFYKSDKVGIVDFTVYPWVHRLFVIEHFTDGELKLDPELEWARRLVAWKTRMDEKASVSETNADRKRLIEEGYRRYWKRTAKTLVGDAVRAGKEAHDI